MEEFRKADAEPGTEDIAAIVAMGKAAEIAAREVSERGQKLTRIRDTLINGLPDKIPAVFGSDYGECVEKSLPGHASFCIEFIEGESMLMMLNSQGSGGLQRLFLHFQSSKSITCPSGNGL